MSVNDLNWILLIEHASMSYILKAVFFFVTFLNFCFFFTVLFCFIFKLFCLPFSFCVFCTGCILVVAQAPPYT